jgi:hypothetical protein
MAGSAGVANKDAYLVDLGFRVVRHVARVDGCLLMMRLVLGSDEEVAESSLVPLRLWLGGGVKQY